MWKFRKKPVEVQAWPTTVILRQAESDWAALPTPIKDAYESPSPRHGIVFAPDGVYIKTLEGEMKAERGDWIICGVKGELYPCKPDIFEATYEAVEEAHNELSLTA